MTIEIKKERGLAGSSRRGLYSVQIRVENLLDHWSANTPPSTNIAWSTNWNSSPRLKMLP
jgi:hypothetical protein